MSNVVQIHEITDNNLKIAIIIGGIGAENPTRILNEAVRQYVKDKPHNVFIESGLTNPWVRVVVSGINTPDYNPFQEQEL